VAEMLHNLDPLMHALYTAIHQGDIGKQFFILNHII